MTDSLYHWLKALHIIAVIAWMAGQLYLPRLFVYHTQAVPGGEADNMLQTMERRLLRAIMNPAMIASFALGLWLAVHINAFAPENGAWLHAKLALVLGLAASHGLMSRWRKAFARGENRRTARFYKIFNEVQTLLLISVIILVVVRPL